jgi:predicted dehydrogenase
MGDPIGVAVVGLNIGKAHLWAYQQLPEHFRVVAVCDIDEGRAGRAAERNVGSVALNDLAQVCARDDVEVVNLCTPPGLHLDHIAQVLGAGKHVVCEKPLVGSLEAVDEVERLEVASGRRVMPIFQYRWGRGLQRVKHLVEAGVAGQLNTSSVEVAWRRRADYYSVPWRGTWAGELGGVLTSHAIHAIDMLTYVVGPAQRVFARTTTRVNPIETEDCAAASLEMADGSLATLVATLGSPEEITRHRFNFTHLSAESGTAAYESSGEPWTITPDSPDVLASIEEAMADFAPGNEGYVGQFERFADSLASGDDPPVTVADARAALELLTALYVSSREGVEVTLPLPPDHPAYRGWTPT